MSDFKVIETQEQLEAVIKDRLERAKKTAKEEAEKAYADYDDLKKQNAELSEKLKTAADAAEETKTRLQELEKSNASYKLSSLKVKVAQEAGLPFEFADRLSGEDEEAIRADAAEVAKYMSKPQVAPLGAAEPRAENKDPFTAGLSELAKNINLDE